MGWTYEIKVWKSVDGKNFGYHCCWHGETLIMAVWNMLKLRRYGWKCIALEWRPQ